MREPRLYWRRVSTYWWLWQPSYLKFILRELTSVFVAVFVVVTLLQIRALMRGPQAYAELQQWLSRPHVLALNAVSFLFVLFHAVSWFRLAPRAMVIRVRGKRVPDLLISGPNYIAWVVISGAIAWLVLGG